MERLIEQILETNKTKREAERVVSVARIKDVIRSRDYEQTEVLERELYLQLKGQEDILCDIVDDPQELINVRAMATRLFIAHVLRLVPKQPHLEALAEGLSRHQSPLIRLGALLGYSDSEKIECVKEFLSDPHPAVVEEAKEILEDAQQEWHK